jgi:hypothetical protein
MQHRCQAHVLRRHPATLPSQASWARATAATVTVTEFRRIWVCGPAPGMSYRLSQMQHRCQAQVLRDGGVTRP